MKHLANGSHAVTTEKSVHVNPSEIQVKKIDSKDENIKKKLEKRKKGMREAGRINKLKERQLKHK